MEWALQDAPGVEKLAIYESRLNFVLPLYSDAVVCAYDTSRFSASVLEDVAPAPPICLPTALCRRTRIMCGPNCWCRSSRAGWRNRVYSPGAGDVAMAGDFSFAP